MLNYFRVIADDVCYSDRWFLGAPCAANRIDVDGSLQNGDGVECWHVVKSGERVKVWLKPIDGLRYPLTIYPDGVCEIDPREFTEAKHYLGPLPGQVVINHAGRQVALNMASFDMPIVSEEVGDILQSVESVSIERFPIIVGAAVRGYEIINIVRSVCCLDESRSHVVKWTEEDGRPDKVTQYRHVGDVTIDRSQTGGHEIFRLGGWEIALIVSERVKDRLQGINDLGIIFEQVT